MRWIAVFLAAVALAGCSGGEDDQMPQAQEPPQAQTPTPRQTPPLAQQPSQSWTSSSTQPLPLEPPLKPIRLPRSALTPAAARPVAASVVGRSVRYVFETDTPARSLKYELWPYLFYFAFGEKGRPMVVRLLDGDGRFAWAAGYDGVSKTWVRARPDLARCGPIVDGQGRRLPLARGADDAPPCPLEPLPPPTILRVLR